MKLVIATFLLSIASFVLNVVATNVVLVDAQIGAAMVQMFAKEKKAALPEVPKNFQSQSPSPRHK
ncbi:MAG: hypothetical protein KJ852_09465 [Gammaproteobacteria bacterium]|nr:hypothetical protein [Gammaproteobacteria bacterium]MBU0787874.1 hypothetical protein [Gammaproteobacteria bacterium]MBU0817008.1 hypothetical protein [Gammaproteobacteria bacterium]MBU1787172.1 hypothetical protein [Gammaproteobacteria bacterium]